MKIINVVHFCRLIGLFSAFLLLSGSEAKAELKIGSMFSDHMVLQAGGMIPVWGRAGIAESITVEINGIKRTTRAGTDGKWKVGLPAMEYGGPYELNVYGDDTLTLTDIMVGEVWLCAGQSNMRMTVRGVEKAREEIAGADFGNIRFLIVPLAGSTVPGTSFNAGWKVCSPSTVADYSATGYFFGRALHLELDVAIGLIDVSYGGATILTFMDEQTVANTKDTANFQGVQRQRRDNYFSNISRWEKNERPGKRPAFPYQHFSSLCYNAMVNPVIPYANRGAIWYQGESNVAFPDSYIEWFGDYIGMMRSKFTNPGMPFYFVQLAGFVNQHNTSVPPGIWAKFRLAQEECLKYANTGMATAMDIGMKENIHPKNKQEVGRRLALCALNQTYGRSEVICIGPMIRSIERKGRTLVLKFDHCEGGLINRDQGSHVKGFSAVRANGEVMELQGKIASDSTVTVKASDIHRIRYAYANYPVCPLYNGAGLPALPFDRQIEGY